jgi:hypothetical protein
MKAVLQPFEPTWGESEDPTATTKTFGASVGNLQRPQMNVRLFESGTRLDADSRAHAFRGFNHYMILNELYVL